MVQELDRSLWRIVNALAGVLVLIGGFCSYEIYTFVRSAAHVTEYTPAVVNHNLFWSMGMATLLAVYTFLQSVDVTRPVGKAADRALTIWLVAAVAFLPLPLAMMFRWHVPAARVLYLGYALKAGCFVYLYWLFFRYHVLNDQNAFTDGWTLFHGRAHAPRAANPSSGTRAAQTPLDNHAAENSAISEEPTDLDNPSPKR